MGRVYTDADQLRTVYSTMFDDVADDESMDELVTQQMVINFRLSDPSADIWIDGRTSRSSRRSNRSASTRRSRRR